MNEFYAKVIAGSNCTQCRAKAGESCFFIHNSALVPYQLDRPHKGRIKAYRALTSNQSR